MLTEDQYWGCRQQLLSGKVIADWVDTTAGPMDPIFGVLLSPTAGKRQFLGQKQLYLILAQA